MSDLRPEVLDALETVEQDCGFATDEFCVLCNELHRLTAELEKVKAERDGLREVLLSVKRDLEVCDWSCVNCGTDQHMTEIDIYDDVCKALDEVKPHD